MSMAASHQHTDVDGAIAQLNAAHTTAELQATLLAGIACDDPLEAPNAALQAAMGAARQRLERLRRVAMLTTSSLASTDGPLSPQRAASHCQRTALLSERRLKRLLGGPLRTNVTL